MEVMEMLNKGQWIDTFKETKEKAIGFAVKRLAEIDPSLLFENKPESRQDIQIEAGKIMQAMVYGRPEPMRTKPSKNTAGARLTAVPENQYHSYPRKLKKDSQKFKYLHELYERKEISNQILMDLASVLGNKYLRQAKRIAVPETAPVASLSSLF